MPISYKDCAPYLSVTLMMVSEKAEVSISAFHKAIRAELLRPQKEKKADWARSMHAVADEQFTSGAMDCAWMHYSETNTPPWYLLEDLGERQHHAVFILRKGRMIALAFSDPAARNTVVKAIRKARFPLAKQMSLLSPALMRAAFVRKQVRTLWLTGTHRRTDTKADSKVLSGPNLGSALNPLEDQSYYFSSVRSAGKMQNVDPSGDTVIGTNPRNGRVWIGPSPDWDSFIDRVEMLFDAVTNLPPGASAAPLPILALPVDSLGEDEICQPYGMSLVVPEEVAPGLEDAGNERWIHEFIDALQFEIEPDDDAPSFTAKVLWGETRYGSVRCEVASDDEKRPYLTFHARDWNEAEDHSASIKALCTDEDFLSVYYDTGHTYSGGQFYSTQFRDARYDDWRWFSMQGYDVTMEKPLDGKKLLIERIGAPGDPSLFTAVVAHGPGFSAAPRQQSGWLICDDGSMESADFIHFDATAQPPSLTLVHAKGSGSKEGNRGVSVSDFEVVVSQALKNLRYLDRAHLADKLESNQHHEISTAVWMNGQRQRNRTKVIAALRAAGSNMKKTVCILQPRVRKNEIDRIRSLPMDSEVNHRDITRLKQLDTLLLAARAECFGLGAEFVVVVDDDSARLPLPQPAVANTRKRRAAIGKASKPRRAQK